MKEILKYLRQINSYSQEEIANKLSISRQSYLKYENGSVVPNAKIIGQLAEIYKIPTDVIYTNKIPLQSFNEPNIKNDKKYSITEIQDYISVNEPSSNPYNVNIQEEHKLFNGIIDGNTVRIIDDISELNLKDGQQIKFYIEDGNSQLKKEKKKAAWKVLMSFRGTLPENLDYKTELESALEEKYGNK